MIKHVSFIRRWHLTDTITLSQSGPESNSHKDALDHFQSPVPESSPSDR